MSRRLNPLAVIPRGDWTCLPTPHQGGHFPAAKRIRPARLIEETNAALGGKVGSGFGELSLRESKHISGRSCEQLHALKRRWGFLRYEPARMTSAPGQNS